MCLAIVKPANVSIPEDHLKEGWLHNPDGGGYCYTEDGKVVIEKGFETWKDFLSAYNAAVEKCNNGVMLVHFRIRSMGARDKRSTHPFEIKDGAFIHNGTLSGTGAIYGQGDSDTEKFRQQFGGKITKQLLKDHLEKWGTALGGNKMAFLFKDGEYVIINANDGVWDKEVWYSNGSYKPYTTNSMVPRNPNSFYGMYE